MEQGAHEHLHFFLKIINSFFEVPGPDALGHFTLLLDEEVAAQHEQQRQNKNKSKQY